MTNIYFEQFFPTTIAFAYNPNHDLISKELIDKCYELQKTTPSGGKGWISNSTYNTSDGALNVAEHKEFEKLNTWVNSTVQDYALERKITPELRLVEAWFNIYKKYDYQEYHKHPFNIISCIYILKADKGAAKVYFKNPVQNFLLMVDEVTDNNYPSVVYDAEPGKLIIFQSHVEHSVSRHELDSDRISLSYNFNQFL